MRRKESYGKIELGLGRGQDLSNIQGILCIHSINKEILFFFHLSSIPISSTEVLNANIKYKCTVNPSKPTSRRLPAAGAF